VKWWHYSAETLQDIAQSVTDSSKSGRISWHRYHCLIASRPFLGNSDGIDESITTRFFSNLNSFSKEWWSGGIIQQKTCRILHNLWLIPQGLITIYHNLFKMRDVLCVQYPTSFLLNNAATSPEKK
jgi:hypothetical protein